MKKDLLRGIGLSGSEIDVYVSLLRSGPCLASTVSSDTGMNRTHVYELIGRLLTKGVANYAIRENRKYFSVISPKNLLNYIDEQQRSLESRKKEISELLPELESLKKKDEGVIVEVFKGTEGAKTILHHVVETGQTLRVFPITGIMFDILPVFYRNYLKRTGEKGIHRLLLGSEDKRHLRYGRAPLTRIRYLPPEYNLPSSTWIYGDFVIIFIVAEDITLVRIRSRSLARTYVNFFNTLWKISKK